MTQLTWHAQDVANAVHSKLWARNWIAQGVSIDSRTVLPGDLFIALKGPVHDGHDHVAAALAAGAVAAIVSKQPKDIASNAPIVMVEDTFKALEDLGRAGRARSQATIIAVTGSVGKTGTKEMLRLMLSASGETYANEGSFNNHWGVPLSLARMPPEAKFGVFELGMNHAGELGPLSQQVQPHIALITNVEAVHLEFFSSIEAIADAKGEIFLGMGNDGTAILNRDNPHFARLDDAAGARMLKRILSFGRDKLADARFIDYSYETGAVEAEILGRMTHYRLEARGEHLAFNSLGALLAAVTAGADIDICAETIADYHPPKGRGITSKIAISGGDITLIDESYNASPVSMRAAIQVLSRLKPGSGGRRIMALGDMRELGVESPALHAALAKDLIEAKIDRVHACGEMMKLLHEELPPEMQGFYAPDSAALAQHLTEDLRPGDIVTVKGSNAINMRLIVDAIKTLSAKKQKKAS